MNKIKINIKQINEDDSLFFEGSLLIRIRTQISKGQMLSSIPMLDTVERTKEKISLEISKILYSDVIKELHDITNTMLSGNIDGADRKLNNLSANLREMCEYD